MLRRSTLLIFFSIVSLFISGCSIFATNAYQAPESAQIEVSPWRIIDRAPPGTPGGTLRVTEFGSGPKTFNPTVANESSSNDITGETFSALMDYDFKAKKVVGALAYKWESSPDKKVWTFHLRKGLRWSDGVPLTADDVVFTFQVIYDPKVENPNRDIAQVARKPFRCEKIDETTVRIILPGVYAPLGFALGSIQIVPKHILEHSLLNGTFSNEYGLNTPPEKIVSSGPFRLKAYVPQQKVVLERNPYFYAKDVEGQRLPYLDRIVVSYVPDMNTQFLKFISGETDVFAEFPARFYDDLKQGEAIGHYHLVETGPQAATPFFVFNENPKYLDPVKYQWFTNRLFRQAMSYAVNREAMIRLAHSGQGYPATQDFHPTSPFFDPKVKPFPYDPEKARELLKEAGFIYKNGKLFDATGHQVQFTLLTNSGNAERRIKGELFKEDLAKIGIEMNFHPVDFNQLVTKLDSSFDWEAIEIGLVDTGSSIEPSNAQNVWLSTGFTHEWYPRQKKPATPWEAEIDRLVYAGTGTFDLEKRKKIYGRIEEILYVEELPMILTTVSADFYAFRDNVGNALPTSIGRFWSNCSDDMLMCQVFMKKPAP